MLNIDALIRSLFALDEGLRQRAANYLLESGEPAIQALLLTIEKNDRSEDAIGYENSFIRQVFVRFGEPAFQAVIHAFDTDFKPRAAVKTLMLFHDSRAVPILMQHIEHNPASASAAYAIEALCVFRDPRAFDLLRSLLTHPNELTRNCAALAIAEYHDPSTIESINVVISAINPHFNYWQRVLQDSLRFVTDPAFKPFSRGFFIDHHYGY